VTAAAPSTWVTVVADCAVRGQIAHYSSQIEEHERLANVVRSRQTAFCQWSTTRKGDPGPG
jgi:hypothetical protein